MKKIIALILALTLSFSLVACSTEVEEEANEPITLRLMATSTSEFEANIVADQLKKAGYEIELNITPDLSTRVATQEKGDYDICFGGWTNSSNIDTSIRSLYYTDASANLAGMSDARIDELIDEAATQTPDEYLETYEEFEKYLIEEQAYIIPLYSSMKIHAYNKGVIDENSVNIPKASAQMWNTYEYVNEEDEESRSLVIALNNSGVMTHLDPIQVNDVTVGDTFSNIYVKLLNLDLEDQLTTDHSLSLSYATSEDKLSYYFLLRDDINFTKIENGEAVDTEVMVSANDVVFSINRAKDPNSVPAQKVHTNFAYVQDVEILTDLEELNTTLEATTGETVYETLKQGIENDITALTADTLAVDNASGTYQVIKVTATEAYPQMLHSLAGTHASVLSELQVNSLNSQFEVETFDITQDIAYGDYNAVKNLENHLWTSGAYTLVSIDDYTAEFTKSPAYKSGVEDCIENVTYKFFKDKDSSISAFRSGEVDYLTDVDPSKYDLLANEGGDIVAVKRTSNSVSFCTLNTREGALLEDKNLRLALMYALDPEAFVAAKNNLVVPIYSTLTPLLGNGKVMEQDLELSQQYLDEYLIGTAN